ncbi:hypothetical protein B0H19DRAFT_90034 [Mycena capillaripes]|nr:hypothetical protein B0H19DRAFT_90034 [Mycena capillaripes]
MFSKAIFLAFIPTILAIDHPVTVAANGGLTFTPNQTLAAVGDTITFTLYGRSPVPSVYGAHFVAVSPRTVSRTKYATSSPMSVRKYFRFGDHGRLFRCRLSSSSRRGRREWMGFRVVSAFFFSPAQNLKLMGDNSLPVVGTDTPQFVYTVVDTAPHFAACMQGGGSHCRK